MTPLTNIFLLFNWVLKYLKQWIMDDTKKMGVNY